MQTGVGWQRLGWGWIDWMGRGHRPCFRRTDGNRWERERAGQGVVKRSREGNSDTGSYVCWVGVAWRVERPGLACGMLMEGLAGGATWVAGKRQAAWCRHGEQGAGYGNVT